MIESDAPKLFHAIGEKSRLKIIKFCFDGELTFDQLLKKTQLEKTLLSKHLKVLKDSSILISQKYGRNKSYSLNPRVRHSIQRNTLNLQCCEIKLK